MNGCQCSLLVYKQLILEVISYEKPEEFIWKGVGISMETAQCSLRMKFIDSSRGKLEHPIVIPCMIILDNEEYQNQKLLFLS